MKINYEDIIKKAHARAEALAQFQTLAGAAEPHADALIKSLTYFSDLYFAVRELDAEAKQIIGAANLPVQHVGQRAQDVLDAFTQDGHVSLRKLLESLK